MSCGDSILQIARWVLQAVTVTDQSIFIRPCNAEDAYGAYFSATVFRLASPVSKSLPTMLSILKKILITFDAWDWGRAWPT